MEEEEITIEDLLKLSPNQVVEEEVKEDKNIPFAVQEMKDFFKKIDEEKNLTPEEKITQQIKSNELEEITIVRDNPAFAPTLDLEKNEDQPLLFGEVVNYNATEEAIKYEVGNPEESDFYKQTQEVANEVDNIIKNPVLLDKGTISPVDAARIKDTGVKETQEIDVTETSNLISKSLLNAPKIIEINPITTQYILPTPENPTGLPGMFNIDVDEKGKPTDNDTSKYYGINSSAYKYIKDAILSEGELGSYNTFDDFAAKASEVTQRIIKQDPLIKKIFAEASFTLKNEEYPKYIEMLNIAQSENGLDTPEEIEALQKEFQTWKDTRYNELIQSTEFDSRGQQYTFATKKILEDLYKPYGRTQEGDLAEIDRQLKEGEISESWWGLKDIGIGMTNNLFKKYKQVDLISEAPFAQARAQSMDRYNLAKKLGLENMTLQQIEDLYNNPASAEGDGKYKKAIEDIFESFNLGYGGRLFMKPSDEAKGKLKRIKDRNLTLKEATEESRKGIFDQEKKIIKTGLSILEDERFQGLLNEIDPNESGFVDTVGQILKQSNMILTFGGEGIAMVGSKIKNPLGVAAYGVGKLMSAIGTLDIAASEFTTQIWSTFEKRIKDRKGEDYQITVDDYVAELEDPDSVNLIQNLISTGAIVGLERLAIFQSLKASGGATKNIASILRREYTDFIKTLPSTAYNIKLSGLVEGST